MIRKAKISELVPDANNVNKGTRRGMEMLNESIQKNGVGRGIVVDKNGVIIGGNKTVERLADLGIEDIVIVPTEGKELVVTQRMDLDMATDPRAVSLALADNRVSQVDLDFDLEVLGRIVEEMPEVISGLWTGEEIGDLLGKPPSLDSLANEYGEPNPEDFWPIISIKISPDTKTKYDYILQKLKGTEAERFASILEIAIAQVDDKKA